MAHNTRTQSDATWTAGNYVPSSGDWASLDAKLFKAINGDRGGCWAPAQPLIIIGIVGGGVSLTTRAFVSWGGSFTSLAGARFRYAGGSLDWPELAPHHVGGTRTFVCPTLPRLATPAYRWITNLEYACAQSLACAVQRPSGIEPAPPMLVPLRVHDGARLASVTFVFRVSKQRDVPPLGMPRFRVLRSDRRGNVSVLKSVAGGADADGFASPPQATSGEEWFAGGAAQDFLYTTDQNNIVDTSLYDYFAQIYDEAGPTTTAPIGSADGTVLRERKADCRMLAEAGAPIGLATPIDGVLPTPGDRVLFNIPGGSGVNGIWVVTDADPGAPGTPQPWVRATDCRSSADFTPGFLVFVSEGAVRKNSMWECVEPTNVQHAALGTIYVAGASGSELDTIIRFDRRAPRGNIYHSILVQLDAITDMRPQ